MDGIVLSILIIFPAIIAFITSKDIRNPIIIINFVYLTWMILGRIGYLNQFSPSFESSLFITINVLIIDAGISIGNKCRVILRRDNNYYRDKGDNINGTDIIGDKSIIIKWIRLFSFLISTIIFINLILNIITGKLLVENIRLISYSVAFDSDAYTQIYFNRVIYFVYQYFVRGFIFFDLTYSVSLFLKHNTKINSITILNFVLFLVIMLSRIEFLKVTVFIILMIMLAHIEINKKQKRILTRVFLFITFFIFIVFASRSVTSEKSIIRNTIDSFIVDFSGSNYSFSKYFDEFRNNLRLSDSPWILKLFGGIGLLVEYLLSAFGLYFDHSAVNAYLGKALFIGSSTHYNAFYTMFFEFLNSGGYLGTVTFSAIIGFICGQLNRMYKDTNNVNDMYIAAYTMYIIVMGTYNYAFAGISSAVIIISAIIARKGIIKWGK